MSRAGSVADRVQKHTRVTTSDHEWPLVTTSDYEWPRVRMHQNILLMSWWRHNYITLSNNHYFTANWPFLETLIPGFDISAISDWIGDGQGDGQGGGMGVQTSRHPYPLISVPDTFRNFFFPPFFPPPVHLPPSFLPGVPNSVHLPPYPHPSKATSDQGRKKERKKVEMTNIKINKKVFCESAWFKEIF